MTTFHEYSVSEKYNKFLSIPSSRNKITLINNIPLVQHEQVIKHLSSYSSFDHDQLSTDSPDSIIPVPIFKREPCYSNKNWRTVASINDAKQLIESYSTSLNDENAKIINRQKNPIKENIDTEVQKLKNNIREVYSEYQHQDWDGYKAEPLKYLEESLKFADTFSFEPTPLTQFVDIVPENDGCLCFEWFKSKSKFISISVKEDTLIYNYKIGEEEGCGETNFSGKQMLIAKIKQIV